MADNTQYSWDDLKNKINLVDFANNVYGYKHNKGKSTNRWIFMENDSNKILLRHDGNRWLFSNALVDKQGGTVVDLVQLQEPNLRSFKDIHQKLSAWLDGPSFKVENTYVPKPTNEFNRAQFLSQYANVSQLTNPDFLLKRGISNEILNDNRFKGRVVTVDFHNEKGTFKNTGFPIEDKQGLIGFDVRNHGFKGTIGIKQNGLWLSRVDTNRPIDNLFLVDSAIDALAHAQLYPTNNNVLYASTSGSISHGQINQINSLLMDGYNNQPIKSLTLGFDAQPEDQRYSALLLGNLNTSGFIDTPNPVISACLVQPHFSRTVENFLSFRFTSDSDVSLIQAVSLLHNKINLLNEKHQRFSGDAQTYKVQDKIIAGGVGLVHVHFKNFTANWMAANELLLDFKFQNNPAISLAFPSGKDWNQELKEELGLDVAITEPKHTMDHVGLSEKMSDIKQSFGKPRGMSL